MPSQPRMLTELLFRFQGMNRHALRKNYVHRLSAGRGFSSLSFTWIRLSSIAGDWTHALVWKRIGIEALGQRLFCKDDAPYTAVRCTAAAGWRLTGSAGRWPTRSPNGAMGGGLAGLPGAPMGNGLPGLPGGGPVSCAPIEPLAKHAVLRVGRLGVIFMQSAT